MGFQFTEGPRATRKTTREIAQIIQDIGENQRYMSAHRRFGVKMNTTFGPGEYGAFSPSPDDDPFASAGPEAEWRVGWYWGSSVPGGKMLPDMPVGWQLIFEVFNNGAQREVLAKARGRSERREVKKFVDHVFQMI